MFVSFSYIMNKKKTLPTRLIKLTCVTDSQEVTIKAAWRDASLTLWDFS